MEVFCVKDRSEIEKNAQRGIDIFSSLHRLKSAAAWIIFSVKSLLKKIWKGRVPDEVKLYNLVEGMTSEQKMSVERVVKKYMGGLFIPCDDFFHMFVSNVGVPFAIDLISKMYENPFFFSSDEYFREKDVHQNKTMKKLFS